MGASHAPGGLGTAPRWVPYPVALPPCAHHPVVCIAPSCVSPQGGAAAGQLHRGPEAAASASGPRRTASRPSSLIEQEKQRSLRSVLRPWHPSGAGAAPGGEAAHGGVGGPAESAAGARGTPGEREEELPARAARTWSASATSCSSGRMPTRATWSACASPPAAARARAGAAPAGLGSGSARYCEDPRSPDDLEGGMRGHRGRPDRA